MAYDLIRRRTVPGNWSIGGAVVKPATRAPVVWTPDKVLTLAENLDRKISARAGKDGKNRELARRWKSWAAKVPAKAVASGQTVTALAGWHEASEKLAGQSTPAPGKSTVPFLLGLGTAFVLGLWL